MVNLGCQRNLFRKSDAVRLYNEVVGEYEDMEHNPADATFQDIIEIADASGYQTPLNREKESFYDK